MKTPIISILDFVMIREGEDPGKAIARSVGLAQHVEKLGYHRFWLPEHHGVTAFASASPAVLIEHIAGLTHSIRVGAGGVMLLNHPPLIIAEQFGTLESIYPGRIDLGLGRAVGSQGPREPITKEALRRDPQITGDNFPEFVAELQRYLGGSQQEQAVKATPGQDTNVPIYLLSSSGYNAQLAGVLGLPFAFAAHIKPDHLISSINLYRESFRPSASLSEPYVMIAVSVLAAEEDEEAQSSFTSVQQLYLAGVRNSPTKLAPKVDSMDKIWTEEEKHTLEPRIRSAIVGSRATVRQKIQSLLEQTEADELIFWSETYENADRHRSYNILAEVVLSLRDSMTKIQS